MISRAPGWTTKLERLFWAALQCLIVHAALGLAAPTVARADDGAPEPDQRAVGMCGTLAQSISAPPPIYPGSDAEALPCAPPRQEIKHGSPVLPQDLPTALQVELDKSAVLGAVVPLPGRLSCSNPIRPGLISPGEEHRPGADRPPRA